jgi:vanillate O-demethylase monooxygenase subunit
MAFITNVWQVAAHAAELTSKPLVRRILNVPILLYRLSDRSPAALLDRCPHRRVPLSSGQRIGDEIQCGYHGLRFAADGQCVHAPGQADIPTTAQATSYPIVERYDLAWIWMGAPALADQALIPDLPFLADPVWTTVGGYLHFGCNHQLVTDNLLDLSHESYIHERTIGNSQDETIADFPPKTTVEDKRIVRVHREMPGIMPPPFYAMILETQKPIDRWQTAVFAAPSLNMTEAGVQHAGLPRATALVHRAMHLLTPETERSTHYFWVVARNFRQNDRTLDEAIRRGLDITFDEDRVMLELQQAGVEEGGEGPIPGLALRVDDGPLRARRIHASQLKAEQTGSPPAPTIVLVPNEAETPAMCAAA